VCVCVCVCVCTCVCVCVCVTSPRERQSHLFTSLKISALLPVVRAKERNRVHEPCSPSYNLTHTNRTEFNPCGSTWVRVSSRKTRRHDH
jgi:hypothetical protein